VAKKVKAVVKVQIQAGKATAAPPVGTALGPHGINMGQFIKEYNEKTAPLTGTVVPAVVTIFEDRSYTFVTKSPPAADLIRKELGIEKGSPTPNKNKVGTLSRAKALDRRDEDGRPEREHDRFGHADGRGHRS